MAPSRRSTSSLSALQILGALVVLLGVGVALAIMLAPQKPEAPPPSRIAYEERPAKSRPDPQPERDSFTRRTRRERPNRLERAPRPQPQATPAKGPGTPAFRVYGTVQSSKDGEPIGRAQVTVARQWTDEERTAWQEAKNGNDDLGEADLKALTQERKGLQAKHDAYSAAKDGAFDITLDKPGEYLVTVERNGYLPVEEERRIYVSAAEPVQRLELKLSRGATVMGRVTEAGKGRGAPGLPVLAMDEEERTQAQAMTEADGRYTLTGLKPGAYGVHVVLSNSAYKETDVLPFERVTVAEPDATVRNVNFKVDPAGVVWGYVTTPDGQPIPRSDVLLATSDSVLSQALKAAMQQAPPVRDRSEDDGYYELLGVPLNEEWQIYATADEYSPQLADPFVLTPQAREVRIDMYMFGGTEVSGRVVDTDGEPVAEAQVVCIPGLNALVSPLQQPQAFREAHTDDAGYFLISDLPAGEYQIIPRKKGYKLIITGDPIYPDGYSPIEGLVLTLEPVGQGEHAVYGTVEDSRGRPIQGAEVALEGLNSASMQNYSDATATDNRGAFRMEGIQAGLYRLTVQKNGYATRRIPRVLLDQETPVVLEATAMVRGRVLVRGANTPPEQFTIASSPLTAEGDMSLGGMMNAPEPRPFANTNGQFELSLAPGTHRLEANSEGYAPGRTNVTVESGEVKDGVVIHLNEDGGRISGEVITLSGESPQGARVTLIELAQAGQAVASVARGDGASDRVRRVGQDGFFLFEDLAPGSYNVIARHEAYANATSGPLTLEEGGVVDNVELRLGSGGMLVGNVSRDGRALEGATVLVASVETGTQETAQTDGSGYYEIDGLASGSYQVTVAQMSSGQIGDLFDRTGATVQVTEGQTTRQDFGAQGGVTIQGMCSPPPVMFTGEILLRQPGSPVLAPPGEGISQENLFRFQTVRNAGVGPGGSFEMEGIQPGSYQVEVYYLMDTESFEFRNVYTGQITVPEQDVMNLPIQAEIF